MPQKHNTGEGMRRSQNEQLFWTRFSAVYGQDNAQRHLVSERLNAYGPEKRELVLKSIVQPESDRKFSIRLALYCTGDISHIVNADKYESAGKVPLSVSAVESLSMDVTGNVTIELLLKTLQRYGNVGLKTSVLVAIASGNSGPDEVETRMAALSSDAFVGSVDRMSSSRIGLQVTQTILFSLGGLDTGRLTRLRTDMERYSNPSVRDSLLLQFGIACSRADSGAGDGYRSFDLLSEEIRSPEIAARINSNPANVLLAVLSSMRRQLGSPLSEKASGITVLTYHALHDSMGLGRQQAIHILGILARGGVAEAKGALKEIHLMAKVNGRAEDAGIAFSELKRSGGS